MSLSEREAESLEYVLDFIAKQGAQEAQARFVDPALLPVFEEQQKHINILARYLRKMRLINGGFNEKE